MGLAEKLDSDIATIFRTTWKTRDGAVVPTTEDVVLKDGAVKLEAVVLYADLFHSTELARQFSRSVAAKIVRAYLSSMTQLIKALGGEVRSFDGDRVMGVFVGDSKNSNAAKCALKMKYVVENTLRPKAEAQFPSLKDKGFKIQHCVGVANSSVFVVRGGVRGSNDLVFIGSSPNIAAKLSEIRNPPYFSYITWNVYKYLNDDAKFSDGKNMWDERKIKLAGDEWDCYRSSWWWKP
jgi:class 3 adenylate cyclase